MKTNFFKLLAGVVLIASFSSCSTLFTKSHQNVNVKGVPGTTITDLDKNVVLTEIGQNGFGSMKLRKQLKSKNIQATLDGYYTKNHNMGTKIQTPFWGNIVLGGIPGMLIDVATGKMMKFKEDFVDMTLTPMPRDEDESEPQNFVEQRVDRANPGITDMEQAILRWYFDSDPRGARIFYRVISNVPAEVKNTNETYLTTTPLEETRGFNIPGLTYENSANVTVEIKLSKRGYEDQVKRFNVRQAIDQQEISGFFELVPKN